MQSLAAFVAPVYWEDMQTSSSARQKHPSAPALCPEEAETILHQLARATDALKEAKPVRFAASGAGGDNWTLYAAENIGESTLSRLRDTVLVLPHARARTLKIPLYTPEVIALPLTSDSTMSQITAICDPTRDLDSPLRGPFSPLRETLPPAFAAAVKLTKLAGLLPAALLCHSDEAALTLTPETVMASETAAAAGLKLVVRAKVPLEGAETTEMVAFRAGDGGPDHFALIIGHPSGAEPVLTRLHSECFTGDLLGSLKCDCGQQLRGAIAAIAAAGAGVLLYLAQEGRGIGLVNKLRAYHLQDQGFDTVEANERLGFEPDERRYAIAAKMLQLLGFSSVRLMTNNPDKVASLAAAGVEVVERVPHAFTANPHNAAYLRTKAEKSGHLL